MSVDLAALSEEQELLLMGLGLPAMMEVRLVELAGMEAVVEGRGRAQHGADGACNLTRTSSVLRGCTYGPLAGEFLVQRGLLEQVHEGSCPHVRLTDWGRDFVRGSIANIVTTR